MNSRTLAAAALGFAAFSPNIALGDATGEVGRVVRVAVNTQGSDKFASFHGSVTTRHGRTETTYFWGGTTCPAQSLTESQVGLLLSALGTRLRVLLPRYRGGAGGTRCLVAFEFAVQD